MIFGEFATGDAEGLILAHAVKLPAGRLPKGHVLDAEDIEALYDALIAAQQVTNKPTLIHLKTIIGWPFEV